jgi:predicted Zn-dependent protease
MPDLDVIAQQLISKVRAKSVSAEVRVNLSFGREGNTRYASGDITTAGDTDVAEVALTVALGKRHATATSSQSDPAALDALVGRTLAMAKLAPEDPENMPVLGPQHYGPGAPEWDDDTAALSHARRADDARAAIAACVAKNVIAAGFIAQSATESLLATSRGLEAKHRRTVASLTTTVRTPDGTGSGWGAAEETRSSGIDSGRVTALAIDKAVRSREPKPLAPGEYTVVLEPAAVGDLLVFLIDALDARGADEGRSFFSKKGGTTKLGERLFAKRVSLTSDPGNPGTPGAPFDGEGVPLGKVSWIENGMLRALRYSRYWAERKGATATGDHSTFELRGGEAADTAALVKNVKRGLLVTRFWYIRWLEPRELSVTGLTRDGVFMIENGAVTHPVNNFRFNDSPASVLANCVDATRTPERVPSYGGTVRVPALTSEHFHMASVSAAV